MNNMFGVMGATGPQGPQGATGATAAGDTGLSTEPPQVSAGGKSLAPGQKLPKRRVKGIAGESLFPQAGEMIPEPPGAGPAAPQGPEGELPSVFGYTGQNLVDSNGVIVRGQYVVGGDSDEAYSELARYDSKERQAFLVSLYNVGLYGRSKPSVTGLASKDLSAVREAMLYANHKGVTLDVAKMLLATEYGRGGMGGAGVRVRPTAKQDLAEVYKQVSLSTIGRAPTQAEINKFVRAYQAQEATEQLGGQRAPNAQVAAQAQVQARNPEEAAAMGALQLANLFDQAVKGLA